jgi:hypothetical protein
MKAKPLFRAFAAKGGFVLPVVLVLLVMGALVAVPLLTYISSGLHNTQTVYEAKTDQLYAADAGIEDASWRIKYGEVENLNNPIPYDPYDFATTWEYDLNGTSQVNSKNIHVSIQNQWIPSNITAPDSSTANQIVNQAKLIVTGETSLSAAISRYEIKISFLPSTAIHVDSIGIWLPRGFTYFSDATHQSDFESNSVPYYAMPATQPWAGNQAVIWNFPSAPDFTTFPQTSGSNPAVMNLQFWFIPPTPGAGQPFEKPDTIAWIKTTDGAAHGYPFAWNADVKVYHSTSVATAPSENATTVDSYLVKSELRHMQSAISGDYYATGNSNLSDNDGDRNREQWHDPSSATVNSTNIPSNAEVAAAYLYWSGWKNDNAITTKFPADGGSDFGQWIDGINWSIDSSNGNPSPSFKGQGGGLDGNLTLKNSLDLTGAGAIVSWDQATRPGTGSQTRVPTGDGVSSGTWNTAPLFDDVDETSPGDSDYITLTAGSGNTGWLSPTSNSADTGGDNNGFENGAANAYADGGSYASNVNGAGDRHRFYGYNTSAIPAGSSIAGIEVRLDWWMDTTTFGDNLAVALSWDGGTNWTSSKSASTLRTSDGNPTDIEGGTTDTWGRAWTLSELSSSNFRVRVTCNSSSGSRDFYLDWIPVRITYTSTPYQLFSAPQFAVPSGATVSNLTVYVRAKEMTSGSNDIRPGIKVNGTLYNTTASGNDPGSSFSTFSYSYSTNPATGAAWTIADINGTGTRPLQQFGVYSGGTGADIRVSMVYAAATYTLPVSSADGLDFAFSADGGSTWSANYQAFRGDIGSAFNSFSSVVPSNYISASFKVRFTLVGFAAGKQLNIDNVKVSALPADGGVSFSIDGQQVYYDNSGNPKAGHQDLISSKSQVLRNYSGSSPHGFSYSCFRDVTELVRKYTVPVDNPDPQPDNYPGWATYSVGGIYASTPRDSQSEDEWAYANWSIIIIYTSPDNLGHQLFLFDQFAYSNQDTSHGVNVDFDNDGQPGGTISGFLVPDRVTGAVTSFSLTSGGSGYTSAPAVKFNGGGGSGAAAMAFVSGGHVTAINMVNGGSHYTSAPTISFEGGGGSGAVASVTVGDEVNAAKMTCYVGEGDSWYSGDYVAMNNTKLWDGTTAGGNSQSNPTNVFNSTSLGLSSNDGIDIDTLGLNPGSGQYITWNSGVLHPGDTSAQIDLVTYQDVWNMIYMVLSFRSVTSTGGPQGYFIK